MRKLVLDLEALDVESFDAAEDGADGGTVHGREDFSNTWCPTNCLSDPCFCHISESGCSCDPC